jgi:hypothetical protein
VALAGGVLHQPGVAGQEPVGGAVFQTDANEAGKGDYVLPSGRWVPVDEMAGGPLPKEDILGFSGGGQFWVGREVQFIDLTLAVAVGVQPEDAHETVSSSVAGSCCCGAWRTAPRLASANTLMPGEGLGNI